MNWLVSSTLLALFAVTIHAQSYDGTKCGKFEVYSKCKNSCPRTCENVDDPPEPCLAICTPGCDCIDGYVLHNNVCIPKEKCPCPLCAGNRTYVTENINVRTCDNINLTPTKPGCYCEEKYVLNRRTGECISPKDCPSELHCYVNEQKSDCVSPCPETCKNPNPRLCRPIRCEPGCICVPPTIRDTESGYCVPPKNCTVPSECLDPHEVYMECGTACEPACGFPVEGCTRQCVRGCFCKPGYIRECKTKGSKCIPKRECPF